MSDVEAEIKAYEKEYRRKKGRHYYHNNREKVRKAQKEYYRKNAERLRAYSWQYRRDHNLLKGDSNK